MKVIINKDGILEGLQKVGSIVGSKTTLPVLYNVYLKAEGGKVFLTATNIDVTVRTSVEANVSREGGTTLPARRLTSIIRELPATEIEINVDDKDVATIKAGSSRFKIIGISEEEFPALPSLDEGKTYTLDQGVFRRMIASTSYSASHEESRYVLNGVLLSFKEDKLTMVATDGRRMALYEEPVEFPDELAGEFIVPSLAVNELTKTLGAEGKIKIVAGQNQISFAFDDIFIVSKLIEGTFPNFRQVIPSACEERVSIERELLLTAIKRVSLVSDKSNTVNLVFSKNHLELQASAQDIGEASETLAVKYGGKDIKISFNPEYLMDCLRALTSDEIALEISDDLSPGVVKCDAPFLYVLMPMRVR